LLFGAYAPTRRYSRTINYSGFYEQEGGGYLSVYGWTTEPLVEYNIIEALGKDNPTWGGQVMGTVWSDGSTYDVYRIQRVNQSSLEGIQTFIQFWSIRRDPRTSGSVNTANHFNAWAGYGQKLGTHNFQIVATNGFGWLTNGSCSLTVS
jgi:endo-1,4-beta-xylanase